MRTWWNDPASAGELRREFLRVLIAGGFTGLVVGILMAYGPRRMETHREAVAARAQISESLYAHIDTCSARISRSQSDLASDVAALEDSIANMSGRNRALEGYLRETWFIQGKTPTP